MNNLKLIHSHSYGEESYGLVYLNTNGEYEVWDIPQYGGKEMHDKTFNSSELQAAIAYSMSFT